MFLSLLVGASLTACSSSGRHGTPGGGKGDGSTTTNTDGGQPNTTCPNGGDTTISGKVYDPAIKNGLYNVTVYVPASPLTALPRGVPTGTDACSCSALYGSGALASTTTNTDGSFTLTNAPAGSSIPLVIQVGKWRRKYTVNVAACQDNPQADKTLAFATTVAAGDTDTSIPDIAVSTGGADTLECLMRRIGLDTSEYVAGASTAGHVHVFAGGGNDFSGGQPESPGMSGAPHSYTDLWASQDQMMPYDVVLLSCEGDETYKANPPVLESYLNAGGRVFASHYHYSWFAGVIDSGQAYSAPADWGTHLASWSDGEAGNQSGQGYPAGDIGGVIDTTLNGSTAQFPKGVALTSFMTSASALGQNGVPSGEVSIFEPRYDAVVSSSNTPSQPWINSDSSGSSGATLYFSFNTPVNAPIGDGGVPNYCGRAVFSDLHVAGDPSTMDNSQPPSGCADSDLSPQEKVLEFMLFDLSSCVVSDTMVPPPIL